MRHLRLRFAFAPWAAWLLLVLLAPPCAWSQETAGSIAGAVYPPIKDGRTHYPLPGVKVDAWSGGKLAGSGLSQESPPGQARYSIPQLPPGTYLVKSGDSLWPRSTELKVTVAAGKETVAANLHVAGGLIWSPRPTHPAMVKAGGPFEVLACASPAAKEWSCSISNGYKTFSLPVRATAFDAEHGIHTLSLTVPADAPEELYGLTIKCSDGSDTAVRSVKVLKEFKSSFYFVHLTDCHVGHGKEMAPCLQKEIEEINLLRPEFVLLTGDAAHTAEAIPDFMKLLNAMEVPTFVTAGNHDDFEGAGKLHTALAVLHYAGTFFSFDYGDCHVAVYDDGYTHFEGLLYGKPQQVDPEHMEWLAKDLQAHQDAKLRIVASHIGATCWPKLYQFLDAQKVQLYLYGHRHVDAVSSQGKTPVKCVMTHANKIEGANKASGYRLIRIAGGAVGSLTCSGEPNATMIVPCDMDVGNRKLALSYSGPNDGTRPELTATIHNAYKEHFEQAAVRFVMPRGACRASLGRIIQAYDSDDGRKTVCYVQYDIPAEAKDVRITVAAGR